MLYQGYYVMLMVGDSQAGGQMTIMITGGENIYTGSNPDIVENVGFDAYVAEKDSERICCDSGFLEHIGENKTFFGIKKNIWNPFIKIAAESCGPQDSARLTLYFKFFIEKLYKWI